MSKMIVVGLALAVVAIGMPGFAGAETTSFHALSKVTAAQPMTDSKLAKVEGQSGHCVFCSSVGRNMGRNAGRDAYIANVAVVLQANGNIGGRNVSQRNRLTNNQSINLLPYNAY